MEKLHFKKILTIIAGLTILLPSTLSIINQIQPKNKTNSSIISNNNKKENQINLNKNLDDLKTKINQIKDKAKIAEDKINQQKKEITELKKQIIPHLNTIITNSNIEIEIETNFTPSKQIILKAIINKNSKAKNLTLNDFKIVEGSRTNNQLKIVGTNNWYGSIQFNYKIKNFNQMLNNISTYHSTTDIYGNLYVSGYFKIYKFTNENQSFTTIYTPTLFHEGLISNKYGHIYGMHNSGVYKSKNGKEPFEKMQQPATAHSAYHSHLVNDTVGNIYFIAAKTIYKSKNGEEPFVELQTINNNDYFLYSMVIDNQNNIYVATGNKVYKSKNGNEPLIEIQTFSNRVKALATDKNDNVYAVSNNSIYKKASDSSSFVQLKLKNQPAMIDKLIVDKNNNIYVTNTNKIYQSKNNEEPFVELQIINDNINSLATDNQGNIYIAAEHGFYKYKSPE